MDEFDDDDEDDDDDDDDETQEFEISVEGIDEVGGPTWIGVPAVIREQLWDARKGECARVLVAQGAICSLGEYVRDFRKLLLHLPCVCCGLKMVDREVT